MLFLLPSPRGVGGLQALLRGRKGGRPKPPATPVLCAVTPTPTSLTLGHPAPTGGERKWANCRKNRGLRQDGRRLGPLRCWWAPPTPARCAAKTRLSRLRFEGADLLLSHGVKRSGGGWEGVVPNNGTLSRALVRAEGCITSRQGTHRTQQLIVEHRPLSYVLLGEDRLSGARARRGSLVGVSRSLLLSPAVPAPLSPKLREGTKATSRGRPGGGGEPFHWRCPLATCPWR